MDKIKIVVSILFLFILISFSAKSSANQEHNNIQENPDSILLVFKQRILDSANDFKVSNETKVLLVIPINVKNYSAQKI